MRPDRITLAHEALSDLADPVADQVRRLRSVGEGVLREHGKIESNDDDRMHSIARLAYKRGRYGYALFED